VNYFVYTTATGEITRYGAAPAPLSDQEGPGETAVEGTLTDINKQYVLNGVVIDKPTVPQPEGASYDLTLLPPGTTVEVTNESGDILVITELVEPLVLENAGTYQFFVAPPFPYQPMRCTIEVS
jgi:hypothetical protein